MQPIAPGRSGDPRASTDAFPAPPEHPLMERKGDMMPLYLSRFSYTPETWARLIGHPEDRAQAAQS